MSSTEWQNTVRAWMAAGAIERDLWRRLSNAHISDADPVTLDAQRRMGQLSAEEASQMVRLMLEANCDTRDELAIAEFLTHFVKNVTSPDRRVPVGVAHRLVR